MSLTATIVIATYNRCALLAQTLDSLADSLSASRLATAPEIVVVDNNSTDATRQVVMSRIERMPSLRHVGERRQGLSFARNAGIESSAGELLVFLDDDVDVRAGWLDSLVDEFQGPGVGVVGGKVVPFGVVDMPDWLPLEYRFLVSTFDAGPVPRDIDKVLGANFAIRRTALRDAGLFNVNLGRQGTRLLGGEEVELVHRIRRAGYRVRYRPDAVVAHKIANKMKPEYIIEYAYWLGVSERVLDPITRGRLVSCLKTLRSAVWARTLSARRTLRQPAVAATRCAIRAQYSRGYVGLPASSPEEVARLMAHIGA